MREPIYRAKILLALKLNEFNDSLLTEGTLNNIFNYQNRMDMIKYFIILTTIINHTMVLFLLDKNLTNTPKI